MQTIEYRTVDKLEWERGPWDEEPDKKQWKDETTGFPCLIVRNHSGALCGYAGVPKNHPFYGKSYDELYSSNIDIEIHGGLTFSGKCALKPTKESWGKWRQHAFSRKEEAKQFPIGDAARLLKERAKELKDFKAYVEWSNAAKICHLVEDGEDDDIWWFGFDCAHCGDLSPAYENIVSSAFVREDVYRDVSYVEEQVGNLAKQLNKLENNV